MTARINGLGVRGWNIGLNGRVTVHLAPVCACSINQCVATTTLRTTQVCSNNDSALSLPVLFFSRPRSDGWPHRGRTFSIYLSSVILIDSSTGVLSSMYGCYPYRLCVVFLACAHWTLFLALSLSPGKSLVSSRCDHSMLASLLWQCLTVPQFHLYSIKNPLTHINSVLLIGLWSLLADLFLNCYYASPSTKVKWH